MLSQWQVKFPVSDNPVCRGGQSVLLLLIQRCPNRSRYVGGEVQGCKEILQQCFGWQLVGSRYWCVSVGFVYRSTDIVSLTRLDLVSRNTCCLVEISAVNFMLGWKLLASSGKAVKVSRPCDHFCQYRKWTLAMKMVSGPLTSTIVPRDDSWKCWRMQVPFWYP